MSVPKLPSKMDKKFQEEIITMLNTQLDIDEQIAKAWTFNPPPDDLRQTISHVLDQQSHQKSSNINRSSTGRNSLEIKEVQVQVKTNESGTASEDKEITCTVCKLVFNNHDIYRAHMRRHRLMLKRSNEDLMCIDSLRLFMQQEKQHSKNLHDKNNLKF